MRHVIIGLVFGIILVSGCDLKAAFEGPRNSPDAPKLPVVEQKIEQAVVPCQNVEVTQTKERTETKTKFEGFQHVERSPQIGQRNTSHCIPCSKEDKSDREKKVCEGEGSGK